MGKKRKRRGGAARLGVRGGREQARREDLCVSAKVCVVMGNGKEGK